MSKLNVPYDMLCCGVKNINKLATLRTALKQAIGYQLKSALKITTHLIRQNFPRMRERERHLEFISGHKSYFIAGSSDTSKLSNLNEKSFFYTIEFYK